MDVRIVTLFWRVMIRLETQCCTPSHRVGLTLTGKKGKGDTAITFDVSPEIESK
jgi:hypothetical protein